LPARSPARARLHTGQPDVAIAIIDMLLMDLPPPGPCLAGNDPLGRIAQLEQERIETRGWTNAYRAQESARLALGDACPCLAGARR
jgi:hypothetical protein